MDKDELLYSINEDVVMNGKFYSKDQIPSQISQAIYMYGDSYIKDIVAFIDASENQDGSIGMIITPERIYFQFAQVGIIEYQKIKSLSLEKHHNQSIIKAIIKLDEKSYAFSHRIINPEIFIEWLSKVTHQDIEMIMTIHEKVAYYVNIILNDLEHDEYEDVELTSSQEKQMKEFYEELKVIEGLDEEDYCYELEGLCKNALMFFDELEIDSEEIDILLDIQEQFHQIYNQEEEKINNAKQMYDDMMNKYQQGDTEMVDKVKGMMESMGLHESDFIGKSNEEIEDMLCQRFGISKSMFESLMKRFKQ